MNNIYLLNLKPNCENISKILKMEKMFYLRERLGANQAQVDGIQQSVKQLVRKHFFECHFLMLTENLK